MKIGEFIKRRRKELNLSQSDIADALFVTIPTVSKWENNGRIPDISFFSSLAKILKVDLESFVKGESKLKCYLIALFEKFGAIIFGEELAINKNTFAQILVNSRNRIAHISSKQDRVFLNGEECVMYLKKLSLLYRIIIFDHLEIPEELYKDKLSSAITSIDKNKTMTEFFGKLKSFS